MSVDAPPPADEVGVIVSFWRLVLADLRSKQHRAATRDWMCTDAFDYWARLTFPGREPAEVREMMTGTRRVM